MQRLPFGISRLDQIIGGGAPRGSVVLVASDVGAGGREFCYTSVVINGLGLADDELFDHYYGPLEGETALPEEIHYISFTHGRAAVENEMTRLLDHALVSRGMEHVSVAELAHEYFQSTPVPREWYTGSPGDITELGDRHSRRDVLDAFASYLTEHADSSLVIVDSVTDLVVSQDAGPDLRDLTVLLKGLARAMRRWDGLLLLLLNTDVLTETQFGRLNEASDGTLLFEWERGGTERDRTLIVQQFRGVLSQLEDENVVQFETEITQDGLDISNVKKVR